MRSKSPREKFSSDRPPESQTARMQIGLAISVRIQVTETASSALCSKTPLDATPMVPQRMPVPTSSNMPDGARLVVVVESIRGPLIYRRASG